MEIPPRRQPIGWQTDSSCKQSVSARGAGYDGLVVATEEEKEGSGEEVRCGAHGLRSR
jgi:hypothetical protein